MYCTAKTRAIGGAILVFTMVPVANSSEVWRSSIVYDDKEKAVERFIPVELFTGAKWDGKQVLTIMTPAKTSQNNWGTLKVQSPAKSKTSDSLVISRFRIEYKTNAPIYQEFDINDSKDGIAMIYQNRRGRIHSRVVTANKFPIGWWKIGEKKQYDDGEAQTEITIIELDGPDHSIKFRWKTTFDEGGHYIYTFVPERGLTTSVAQ